jgi:hypothetical protein
VLVVFKVEFCVAPLDREARIRSNECQGMVGDRDEMEEERDNKGGQQPLGFLVSRVGSFVVLDDGMWSLADATLAPATSS